jgi:hypothetical protein
MNTELTKEKLIKIFTEKQICDFCNETGEIFELITKPLYNYSDNGKIIIKGFIYAKMCTKCHVKKLNKLQTYVSKKKK